jgi:hypothetical protein
MVKQTSGSACNFRTKSLDRLNNTYRPNAEWNQDCLRINAQSYYNNRFLLYSSDNNSHNIYHENIRDLQGKTNELINSLYPELPQLLCLMEDHLYYLDLDQTYIQHYNLGAEYCRQALRQRGVGTSHSRNNPLPRSGSLTYVSETTHSWKAVIEPLEAVISTRSSGSYKGSSFVNPKRKPAERCACCKHGIVGTILLAFKSRLVCIFWTSTINIYT